jgi:hypothetical protein
MNTPHRARSLLTATFELYRRYPALFLVLDAAVIVPYELLALAATGTGSFSRASASFDTQLPLTLLGWFLITPLVSALHVNAVAGVRSGRDPHIGAVARRGAPSPARRRGGHNHLFAGDWAGLLCPGHP